MGSWLRWKCRKMRSLGDRSISTAPFRVTGRGHSRHDPCPDQNDLDVDVGAISGSGERSGMVRAAIRVLGFLLTVVVILGTWVAGTVLTSAS